MSVNHILIGQQGYSRGSGKKGYYRFFVDIVCDGKHDGVCGSDNPECSFKNLAVNELHSKCKELAAEASVLHQVPIVDEQKEKTITPYQPVGMLEDNYYSGNSDIKLFVWAIREGTLNEVLAGYHGEAPVWYEIETDEEFGQFFLCRENRYFMNNIVPVATKKRRKFFIAT